MASTAGKSSARARIAACDVPLPPVVQTPRTRRRSSEAVSEGARSSATTMASAGNSGGALVVPVRILGMHLRDEAAAGCEDQIGDGIDRDSVAHEPFCERRIRDR
ncbi:MAG TPA: hypothetical protein VJ813_19465 [Vicinamibacterales bacterium]|nr:hypothetical protein [Vicinamibacterales bacterium]